MPMDCRDAVDQIALAAERLKRLCAAADGCGRGGAASVFYGAEDLLWEIDTARDAIAKLLGIPRNEHLEKLGVTRPPAVPKSNRKATAKGSRR